MASDQLIDLTVEGFCRARGFWLIGGTVQQEASAKNRALPSRKFGSNMELCQGGGFCPVKWFAQQEASVWHHQTYFHMWESKKTWFSFFSVRILTWLVLVLVWARVTLCHYLTLPTLTAIELSLSGPAALVCAETLRQEGFTDRIVMCSMDKHPPYDRPKLSKVCTESLQHTVQWRRAACPSGSDSPAVQKCL